MQVHHHLELVPPMIRSRAAGFARVLAVALALNASRAAAQRPSSSDAIPRDLAAALLAEIGATSPDFIVGGIPPMFADRIPTLPGARVLGSMLTPTAATIAMSLPLRADSVRTLVMRELTNRGWRGSPVGNTGGGFRPASSRGPSVYCADGRGLTFSLSVPSYGTTLLRFVIRDGSFNCGAATNGGGFVASSSFMPTLVNPRDVLPSSATCRTQGSGFGQLFTTAMRVAMTPEQLMDHYAKQLTDSGYLPLTGDSDIREMNRTFTRRRTPMDLPSAAGTPPVQTQTVTLRMSIPSAEPECRTMRMETTTTFDQR